MTRPAHDRLDTLDDLLAALPARGEHPAIVTLAADGKVSTVSYAELNDDLSRFACGLRDACGDSAFVLLWAPNSAAWITTYLGIVAAGAVVVPLDDQAGAEGLRAVLAQNEPAAVVTATPHLETLREAGIAEETVFLLDAADDARNWRQLMRDGSAARRTVTDDKCVAALLYTSGTTGTPKGVPLTHQNLMSNVRGLLTAGIVRESDRVLLPLPLHHAYPATVGMLTVLARGAAIVLPAGVTGPELTTAANRAGATILVGVPRLYEALLESVSAAVHARTPAARTGFRLTLRFAGMLRRATGINIGRLAFRSLHRRVGRSLRTLASGGARLDPALATRLEALGWLVLTGYGLTETSPVVTFNVPRTRRLDTQGRALAGVEIRIDDPAGEGKGEIQVRGLNVFSGYWGDAAATARAFVEDRQGDRWFCTGDSGFLDRDGFLHVFGRQSDVIVLSDGKKISPETLERRYEESPYIREVALLAPQGDLLALVVPDEDAVRARGTMSQQNLLRDELDIASSVLPSWQRINGYRVLRHSLPRTRLGKLRRHLLPALYAQSRAASPPAMTTALGDADRRLLQSPQAVPVWRWLNERYAGVTLDSSPQLDLGVDSLGWVSLTAEIEDRFGVTLGSEQLSRVLTMRDLLQAIDRSARASPGQASAETRADEGQLYPGSRQRFASARHPDHGLRASADDRAVPLACGRQRQPAGRRIVPVGTQPLQLSRSAGRRRGLASFSPAPDLLGRLGRKNAQGAGVAHREPIAACVSGRCRPGPRWSNPARGRGAGRRRRTGLVPRRPTIARWSVAAIPSRDRRPAAAGAGAGRAGPHRWHLCGLAAASAVATLEAAVGELRPGTVAGVVAGPG